MDKEKEIIPTWGTPDPDPSQPPVEPVAVEPLKPIVPVPYDEHEGEKLTVLYGYGRVLPHLNHYVDEVLFRGGVAKNIPFKRARELKVGPNLQGVVLMPSESTSRDWNHATGLNPDDLTKVPRVWNGTQSDFRGLIDEFGLDGVKQMARDLASEVYSRDMQEKNSPHTLAPDFTRHG